jgi:DNA polymerase-1
LTTSTLQKTSGANATLQNVVRAIEVADIVGFDLETTGLDPTRDNIRLAQVSTGAKTFVVDLFRVSDARPLFEALARDDLTVIAHHAAFEYGFVYQKYGIALDNLRDTLLLARLAARGGMDVDCDLGAVAYRELDEQLD